MFIPTVGYKKGTEKVVPMLKGGGGVAEKYLR